MSYWNDDYDNEPARYYEAWHENDVIVGLLGFFGILAVGMGLLFLI